METNFLPSLLHLSLAKVAVKVGYDKEIRTFTGRFNESWKVFVNKKIVALKLPKELEVKLIGALRPIILEIEEWIDDHDYLAYEGSNLISYICWKSEGTIDRKNTAMNLIGNKNIETKKRFIFACNHCLKNEIWDLWNALPEDEQEDFHDETSTIVKYWLTWVRQGYEPNKCWSKIFHDADTLPYFMERMKSSDDRWNLMINMFPEFILTEELNFRERVLYDLTGCGRIKSIHPLCLNTNIIRLFLSQMDREQQIQLFKQSPLRVLECYLNWPLQSSFMTVLRGLWEYLSEEYYLCLLQLILYKKIAFGFEDCDYVQLLREVWQESPEHLKAYIKEDDLYQPLMNTIDFGVSYPYTRQKLWQTAMYVAFKWTFNKNHYMSFSLKQMLFAAGIKHDFSSEFSSRRPANR
ncbi:uncharacterized protein LOC129969418 [Argiope bruennichi]|uniref:uncharacterized protein LOC129969418 n=1 Tax=Argiope bruennichi TaxID=94029 RepID=UPI00249448D4|nr:uncharacterized protein LOC129969418 [Argiope bruennichi]XP_055939961.1 uncharacterized protein LOC129969418 [Argiope bruennichi]XP_055939962.1 uncharacterized protein LOC129969418 [Argiope bruennichi]